MVFVNCSPPYLLRQGLSLNMKQANWLDWPAYQPWVPPAVFNHTWFPTSPHPPDARDPDSGPHAFTASSLHSQSWKPNFKSAFFTKTTFARLTQPSVLTSHPSKKTGAQQT